MLLMGGSILSLRTDRSHGPHTIFRCGLGDVREDLYIHITSNYRARRLSTVFYGNITSIMGV
jgi:hypothetical protein